jgi:diacylglycerol kinase family enzyme
LLVANNAYDLSLFTVGERPRLDEGRLYAYAAEGWLPRHWRDRSATSFRIEAPGTLEAAVDGEPTHLEPPFEVAIEPRALRVLLPPAG